MRMLELNSEELDELEQLLLDIVYADTHHLSYDTSYIDKAILLDILYRLELTDYRGQK